MHLSVSILPLALYYYSILFFHYSNLKKNVSHCEYFLECYRENIEFAANSEITLHVINQKQMITQIHTM
jgi:hypothetical protein